MWSFVESMEAKVDAAMGVSRSGDEEATMTTASSVVGFLKQKIDQVKNDVIASASPLKEKEEEEKKENP